MSRKYLLVNKSISVALLVCITLFLQISSGFCRPQNATSSGKDNVQAESEENLPKDQIRVSRSADTEIAQENRHPFPFPPPTLKNKFHHGRVARFHGNNPSASRFLGANSGYGSPIARMMVSRDTPTAEEQTEQDGQQGLDDADPTFTPFISARIFNMPQFMEHMRSNLMSLQMNEEDLPSDELALDDTVELDNMGFGSNLDNLPEGGEIFDLPSYQADHKGTRHWLPASLRGRSPNIRHFVNHQNPARNAYEFGLG